MKRQTHLLMGVASAVPVALTLPPLGAAAALWFGMTGGALPDYVDLRSEARRTFRHRGASHGLVVNGALVAFCWFVLDALSRDVLQIMPIPANLVWPLTIAFACGIGSHLLGDACTRAGIQPLLPLSRWRMRLLPRLLRGRSDGRINSLETLLSLIIIGTGAAYYLVDRWGGMMPRA